MAPEAPDPQSLKSWADAFQYPIPTVRRVEMELRRDITSNKEKLRALVGTRYRELVGTAETIVAMNTEIQQVETLLTDVGRRCNPQLVEKKHLHARQMKSDKADMDADKHAFGAQLALLHRCTASISRLLRKRASLLFVAKILIVSRQLDITLLKHESSPPFLNDLRSQLASLHQTLLKRINKRLASSTATEDSIIESLAAYCLATKSSSDDAIHKFHQVRLDVITANLDLSRENIPKALRLFILTLQTSKTLRSRQFSDVLSKLKSRPILSDSDIRNLDSLDIEILGRWASSEVNNFTPWIKLSELNRTEGIESIREWSSQAFEKLAECLDRSLAHSNDFTELLFLRAETVELWLSSWGSTITHRSADVLKRLRDIFNDHTKRVLVSQVKKINEIGFQISSTVSKWDSAEHFLTGSLWDSDLITADLSDGANSFKQTVTDRLLGRNHDVTAVLKKYHSWLSSIGERQESIEALRRLKWTDILVGGEVEDEDIDITPCLNDNDPKLLSDALHSAVRESLKELESRFNDTFKVFGDTHQSAKATFLLRLIRLVRRDIPAGFVEKEFLFSRPLVPQLQALLASDVVAQVGKLSLVLTFKPESNSNQLRNVPGRTLWEGEPPVPTQPSASTFKFLRQLTAVMDEAGTDLWDPSTVSVLKTELHQNFENAIGSTLDDMTAWGSAERKIEDSPAADDQSKGDVKENSNDQENPTSPSPDTTQAKEDISQVDVLRDWQVQLLFDSTYLANMLGNPTTQLAGVIERIQNSMESDAATEKGIQKGAVEYWNRTELLFGLLADR
ncbi:uncharacterized protein N7483_008894 [Penicillium malachiteum]|uniref:uncharacterized protein n=1 Tax=Penicillium malachiteum TaxID=1324776 RepID=UPI002546EF00|nr:uncharacterized protein N7483_008894 [Penicillium malachiteum]KAJ5720960.1 hypothetical protein N7483_008894 [Penicillium malachiteum]